MKFGSKSIGDCLDFGRILRLSDNCHNYKVFNESHYVRQAVFLYLWWLRTRDIWVSIESSV
jgi:hypothetical protein